MPEWGTGLAPLERDAVVFRGVQVLNPGPCARCHPHDTPRPGIVLVDYLDRFGHHQRRALCEVDMLGFLHDAVSDYTEILVYFLAARSDLPEPARVPAQVHAPMHGPSQSVSA